MNSRFRRGSTALMSPVALTMDMLLVTVLYQSEWRGDTVFPSRANAGIFAKLRTTTASIVIILRRWCDVDEKVTKEQGGKIIWHGWRRLLPSSLATPTCFPLSCSAKPRKPGLKAPPTTNSRLAGSILSSLWCLYSRDTGDSDDTNIALAPLRQTLVVSSLDIPLRPPAP
jgi:hypothetical protein